MKVLTRVNWDEPCERYMWAAVYEGYDYENDDPVGYGATEQEAIDDLYYDAVNKGFIKEIEE